MTVPVNSCVNDSSRYCLSISENEVFFDPTLVGNISSSFELTLENIGWEDVLIQSISVNGPFALVRTNCPDILKPQQVGRITVSFVPTSYGPWTGSIFIEAGYAGNHNVRLIGAAYNSNQNGNDLSGIPIFLTRADLEDSANLVYPNGSYALVVSDEALVNNDFYRKTGNSGEGNWGEPLGKLSTVIINGQIDLENLDNVINGAADLVNPGHPAGTVTLRNGETYRTLANILDLQITQEEIAIAQAGVATTQAQAAAGSSGTAVAAASTATTQAAIAMEQADIATAASEDILALYALESPGAHYPDVGAGEAATATDGTFWVASGGTLSLYRRTVGSSTLVYTAPKVFSNFFEIADAAGMPASIQSITTSRYNVSPVINGRVQGGGARYLRWTNPMAALPAWGEGIWWQEMLDGSRWFLDSSQSISSAMFGTVGDGAMPYLSDTATGTIVDEHLNNMRRWGLSAWGVPVGFLSHGDHRVEDCVHLSLGETYSLGYTLLGVSEKPWGLWSNSFYCSRVVTSRNDIPIFAISGCRGGVCSGIVVYGPLTATLVPAHFGRGGAPFPVVDDRNRAAWLPAAGPHTNGRYNPGCGFALDPFAGVKPASGAYPTIKYNTAAGESAVQYGRLPSSVYSVKGCVVGGFSVGVAVQPCDYDANGDYFETPNLTLEYCIVGIAVGNSQARGLDTTNLNYVQLHTVMDGVNYGKQRGSLAGTHDNWTGGHTLLLVEYNPGYTGALTLNNFYAEGNYRLANVVGSSGGPLTINARACNYMVGADAASVSPIRGYPLNVIGQSPTSGVPVGCQVRLSGQWSCAGLFIVNASDYEFDGSFSQLEFALGTPCPQYMSAAMNSLCNGLVAPMRKSTFSENVRIRVQYQDFNAASTPNAARLGYHYFDGVTAQIPNRSQPAPIYATQMRGQHYGNPIPLPFQGSVVVAGTSASLTGHILKMTYVGYAAVGHHVRFCMLPGDIWEHPSGYWGVVTAYDTTTNEVTIDIRNGWASNGASWVTGSAASVLATLSAGIWYTKNGRRFGPNYPLYGDITSASGVITNVGRQRGMIVPSGLNAAVAAGDRLHFVEEEQGNLMSPLATISATDETAKTITFTGGTSAYTQVKHPLTFCTSIVPNVINP